MSARAVRLLHVEDDVMQQRMIAHHLRALQEYVIDVTAATNEESAMARFQSTHFDLVLLDYQLAQGDGLHLLGRLREIDSLIPIIAISGVATSEVAAKLVQAGADDYFDKRALRSGDLAKSIQSCIRRAAAVRARLASRTTYKSGDVANDLTRLYENYANKLGSDFLGQLGKITCDMKSAHISPEELEQMHEVVSHRLEATIGCGNDRVKLLTRPLLLELLVRVHDDIDACAKQDV